MPVTINTDNRRAATATDLSDYAWPSERNDGLIAFWGWIAIIAILSFGLSAIPATRSLGIGIGAWWIASVLFYFVVFPFFVRRRLVAAGDEHVVSSRRFPRQKAVLSKGASMLGISEPPAFMVEEGAASVRLYGRKQPYFMAVAQASCDNFAENELDCLVVRSLVHARQRHTPRLMLLQLLADTPPIARSLAWPVLLYASLLRVRWLESADKTADRLTLLIFKNHKLLLASLLKQQITTDPALNSHISMSDVDRFVQQGGTISLEGTEISTQYKLGSAIHANPTLEDRVRALQTWSRSPELTEAIQKLSTAHAPKTTSPRSITPQTTQA